MPRFPAWIVLLVLGLLTASLRGQNPNPDAALRDTLGDIMYQEYVPGAATAIVKDGKILWMASLGDADVAASQPVRDSTVFMLASVSKLVTATAALQQVERGLLHLDRDVNRYLDFVVEVPFYESDSITLRHLLTHTASIADEPTDKYYVSGDPSFALDSFLQAYLDTAGRDYDIFNFYDVAPGDSFVYSNIGTALVAHLVEKSSGLSFPAYCRQEIFQALCMDRTSWRLSYFDTNTVARPYRFGTAQNGYVAYPHYGYADYPSGQLRSSIADMAHFMIAYLKDAQQNQNILLRPSTVQSMWQPQVPALQAGQGLTWYQDTLRRQDGSTTLAWSHNGGDRGVSTDLMLLPQENMGLAVLTNGDGADNRALLDALYQYARSLGQPSLRAAGCPTLGTGSPLDSPAALSVYPQPSKGVFFIKASGPMEEVKVYSSSGRKLLEKDGKASHLLRFEILQPGIYHIIVGLPGLSAVSARVLIRP